MMPSLNPHPAGIPAGGLANLPGSFQPCTECEEVRDDMETRIVECSIDVTHGGPRGNS